MKEKLTRNVGMKILSIILAALLWLIITNLEDPVVTKFFDDVTVRVLNEDEIEAKDQVYEIIEGATIDFTIAAKRSIKENLTKSDFLVTADLSKLSEFDTVTIKITCPRYGNEVTVIDGLSQVLKVKREDVEEQQFKVNVTQKGEPPEGYYVANKSAKKLINVFGPASKIERIAEVVVEVDVSTFEGSFSTEKAPKALDKDGKEIDASNLKFSDQYIPVDVTMYRTKVIDLTIETVGEPGEGFMLASTPEYEPKTIEVTGKYEDLNSITSLTIKEDITGITEDLEKEVNIKEQLPEGIILVGDNETAVVKITLEKAKTKEVMIWPADIDIRNKPQDLDAAFVNTTPITAVFYGPVKDIDAITLNSLKPYIDLSSYSAGTYEVSLKVEADSQEFLMSELTTRIYLKP